ncbi:hypothetical protein DXG03_009442 [Asterophora parasitica]|uniref:Uncharacterized protein n=1 Tax=Asterophora parasitica TaxID=117018 RepID=A0A9P7KG51_9AGAR|nr:hypothetical protein DXG03_009442 [Asterophora parasitica]
MPQNPSAHALDSRVSYTPKDTYRASSSPWGIDTRPLPAHSAGLLGTDDKYAPKSTAYAVYYSRLKAFVSRYWNARTSWSHPKPSLTTANPPSSTAVFILLCTLWYSTSALSSNTGKAILNQFRYPVTLTFVQFGFVAFYCLLLMTPVIQFSKFRPPNKAIIQSTLPMGMFQVVGHMFSSIAISRIPVSTVHTIKALSPLFTVAAYALLFGVSYSSKTYISLLPLTLGVMLACSFDMSASNAVGLVCAFGSALVFVSSNIFFKKIMPSSGGSLTQSSHKLDKLNLLLYSSGMAFILMIPLWIYYDLPILWSSATNPTHIVHPNHGHESTHSVTYYFFMNGTVHFAQNIIAFIILSSTSPVTYSIASLIKRVAVICIAIVWFNQTVHPVQAFGILLTFTGLYMYNNAKSDVEKGEKKMRRVEAARDLMLPTTKSESRLMTESDYPPDFALAESTSMGLGSASAYGRPNASSTTTHTFHHPHSVQNPPYPHPTLSIQITSPTAHTNLSPSKDARISSPLDSYPSPPPSVDSPPTDAIPLPDSFLPSDTTWTRQTFPTTMAPRPSPGPHKLRESLPLTIFLRNRLKYALNGREVTSIVHQRLIKIDGKVRTDETYPAGFQDVISIEKSGEHFRLLYDVKGRFTIHRITPEEATYKLLKVRRVAIGARGVPHIVTHDGRTIRYPDPAIQVNDTVKFDLVQGKIVDFVKFDTGNIVSITGGRNMGRAGVIVHREKHIGGFDIVHVKDSLDRTFATRISNIFVIGEGIKPWISLPKGKGLKLTISEERDVRRKQRAADQ